MGAKCIYIAGVPCSGKSTLFRALREELFSEHEVFSHGLVRGIQAGRHYMLGVFDGSTFEGTDRLSNAVIDDAIEWYKRLPETAVLWVEGDRLLNERFIRATHAKLIVIDADASIIAARHRHRGDRQGEAFLRGRRTKVDNIARKMKAPIYLNNTEIDKHRIVWMLKRIANAGKGIL